ncbi:hypothetical protein K439DRAFT_25322 [Ramaria rubella]|nr:hypothetical protein K439DRAFT_25322 [Ramaria rubella]
MFNSPSRRIYLGRLPTTFQRGDVEKHLSSYGTIVECKVMDGYGFVEFLSLQDAEDVVETFSRQSFLGEHIVCEFAKPMRKSQQSPGTHAVILPQSTQLRYCVWVFNLSEWTRWQSDVDVRKT